ncbi:MAG: AAA family ATPase, partial [Dehalococcoidia bacterium]|nr:AAA family ATPase [Dehalococcoidia bacterium]
AREKGVEVRAFQPSEDNDEEEDLSGVMESAMREAEEAAQRVLAGEFSVELTPQSSYVRRLQHLLAERFSLASTSRGREPVRAVLFYRP